MARLHYAYDNRYMITTTVRRDGYSAFGQENPYAIFPSVALGWVFSEETSIGWNMENSVCRGVRTVTAPSANMQH